MVSLWNRGGFSFSRIKMARLSAAKARVSRRIARAEPTVWQRIALVWKALPTVVLTLAGLFTFVFIAVLLWQALAKKTIAIAPISVPKMLAESGYTADVAAQRLHDALNKVVKYARTRKNKKGPVVALQADLPSIVVPTIGLSLETIAADIRTFFRIARRSNISGEFTIAQKLLWLRLRINGQDFFISPNGVDPERPDDLLLPAAEKVFEWVEPYIVAASLSQRDPGKCLEIVRRIIANGPETDQSVPLAHDLVGVVLSDQHKTEEAIAEWRTAIKLDSRDAWPHEALGFVLTDQHKTEEAIAEYRKAIMLDPHDGWPHRALGDALSDQGKTEEAIGEHQKAIGEYRKAIEVDPHDAGAHIALGVALSDQHKTEEAIAEWRTAIEFDPHDARPHNLLGVALSDQHKTEEAIAEYRKAIELDPHDGWPHRALGDALSDQGKTEEAIGEYRKAIEVDPHDAGAHIALGVALALIDQGQTEEAIAEYQKAIELDPHDAKSHPRDAYPVLWLYLARARSGAQIAAAELETNAKKLKQPDWPYPVVELFLGRRTPEATSAAATKSDDR
jgi:tetratricopeptide (TPR) repeat protein